MAVADERRHDIRDAVRELWRPFADEYILSHVAGHVPGLPRRF